MLNGFSTEATAIVYETLASDLNEYERLQQVAREHPSEFVEKVRTFTEQKVGMPATRGIQRMLIKTALSAVRYSEIRTRLLQ